MTDARNDAREADGCCKAVHSDFDELFVRVFLSDDGGESPGFHGVS